MTVDINRTPFDAYLEAVGHPQRRQLLFTLLRVGAEQEVSLSELGAEEPEQELSLSMRHVHLPKLAEIGIVEFDDDLSVRRGSTFDRIEPLVRLLDENRDLFVEDLV